MRTTVVAAAFATLLSTGLTGCKLASQDRVQSINRMNEGISMWQQKNASAAEKYLNEAIQLDPTHAKAYFTLGQIHRKQNKLVDAEKMFESAIQHMGAEPDADYYYQLGAVQAAQGEEAGVSVTEQEKKFNDAIASFQEAIKLNPNKFMAHHRTGVLYGKLDQPEKADAAFRSAITVNPKNSPSFVELGNMYIDYGFANVAMAVLDAGAQINDKDARMWNGLGRAHLALNKPKEAVDAFKTAKAIDPDMPDVLFGLGMAYVELRQRQEAVENLNAFLTKAGSEVPEDKKKAANDAVARMSDVI